jgi:hypothetical protein
MDIVLLELKLDKISWKGKGKSWAFIVCRIWLPGQGWNEKDLIQNTGRIWRKMVRLPVFLTYIFIVFGDK